MHFKRHRNARNLFSKGLPLLLLLWSVVSVRAQQINADVRTISGAFAGFVDGDNNVSQLNGPSGIAFAADGSLLVADTTNNAIRKITVASGASGGAAGFVNADTSTLIPAVGKSNYLSRPVALAVDANGNIFVANNGAGNVLKYDSKGNYLSNFVEGLTSPTALYYDKTRGLYIAEKGGRVLAYPPNNAKVLTYSLARPNVLNIQGLAVLKNSDICLSDAANHVIWSIRADRTNSDPGFVRVGILGAPGRVDGVVGVGLLNAPHQIAVATNDTLVIADRLNHSVRFADSTGKLDTLFGVETNSWYVSGDPGVYPGWADGKGSFAESREPVGVAVSSDGLVYDTEAFYHIVRRVSGLDLPGLSNVTDTNQIRIAINPSGGFFPNGTTVTVTSLSDPQNGFGDAVKVYYTTDGSAPGVQSALAPITAGVARIVFTEQADLSVLRVVAYNGSTRGIEVQGGVVQPDDPVFSPNSGTYTKPVFITITSAKSQLGVFPPGTEAFYTLDGSTPTRQSLRIGITNGLGGLLLPGPVNLKNLTIRTFLGTIGGTAVSGVDNGFDSPVITPGSGYYPQGVDILVTNTTANGSFALFTELHYTTDGTEPTRDSPLVPYDANRFGRIQWRETDKDLTSLKVQAFSPTNTSAVTVGVPASFTSAAIAGELGIAPSPEGTNIYANIGQALFIPVVLNLKPGVTLRSLQYVVEVVSLNSNAPAIDPRRSLEVQKLSATDFIPYARATTAAPTNVPSATKLGVAYLENGTNFFAEKFAVVNMLKVIIPPAPATNYDNPAKVGGMYQVLFSRISGSTSGGAVPVNLVPMSDKTIVITNIEFQVGKTVPAYSYNAAPNPGGGSGFGSKLPPTSADVANAYFASLGLRKPFAQSDLFDAMDVYPEEAPALNPKGVAVLQGGDKFITLLDWYILLLRSLGLSDDVFYRTYDTNGFHYSNKGTNTVFDPTLVPASISETPLWRREVVVRAKPLEGVNPGSRVGVPVYVKTRLGASVKGLQLVARVDQESGQEPPVDIEFIPAAGIPAPIFSGNSVPVLGPLGNGVYAGWGELPSALQGEVKIGEIRFTIPGVALPFKSYTVRFEGLDAIGPGLAQYQVESFNGRVWVEEGAREPQDTVSDEWKARFFGSVDAPESSGTADADHDGLSNFAESLGGTDPTQADWRTQVSADGLFHLRWFGAAGVSYQVETASSVTGSWKPVGSVYVGGDLLSEFVQPAGGADAFFRVKALPAR